MTTRSPQSPSTRLTAPRRMHLIAYMKTGPTALHSGGWRHPGSPLNFLDPAWYEEAAVEFERARLDGTFFADLFGIADTYKGLAPFLEMGGQNSYLDPMTVLPLMARVTSHLGLGATVSTSFHSAFHLARSLQSVDVLSGGRVAWNVVTSATETEAANFGAGGLPPHDERYDRADEVLEAVTSLWDSWQPDAFVFDRELGRFADSSKVSYVDYEGRWTRTRGPLPTPRSAQGHPVLMQAGSSGRGREFAARWAEVVFAREAPVPELLDFRSDMRERTAAAGRDPEAVKILPGVTVVVAETDAIAREKAEYLASLEHNEYASAYQSMLTGADLSTHATTAEVEAARGNAGIHGIAEAYARKAAAEGTDFARAVRTTLLDHAVIGSPSTVADVLQERFEAGVGDGFVLMPTTLPTSHVEFCRLVVPELQRRGLFRTEYAATTLRENLRRP
ncbi:NtaA/DmoA family FMN-dependent monooxygenase [Brevibacterium litoralis]|uniref:NtaA/DmoA family FMN-dependent monooxygenase n=1 Tax=Brevibacterium litoralis TaxID=3138935 RepID=UPI0032EF1583